MLIRHGGVNGQVQVSGNAETLHATPSHSCGPHPNFNPQRGDKAMHALLQRPTPCAPKPIVYGLECPMGPHPASTVMLYTKCNTWPPLLAHFSHGQTFITSLSSP